MRGHLTQKIDALTNSNCVIKREEPSVALGMATLLTCSFKVISS
jgi:hypothetical protein